MKQRLFVAALLATAVFPSVASAQQWLADRRAGEGIGIRVGNLELHPGVGAEFGYDTNYFQRADSEDVVDALRLRITPSLSLSTLGPERMGANPGSPPALNFRASVFAAYNELFAAGSNPDGELKEQRHVNVGASLLLDIAPQRPFGADIHADFLRVGEPSNSPDTEFSFNRASFRTGTGVTWRPGGGLFEWRFGYEFGYNYFEASSFENFDNLRHTVNTRGRWRFLPRTSLLYDGAYTFIRYVGDRAGSPSDGEVIRSRVGINGLVSTRVALLALAGWTASFYDTVPQNQDTFVGHLELKYFVMPPPGETGAQTAATGLSTIALGYVRDVSNSYLNSFYQRDRGYLNFRYFLGGMVVMSLEGGLSHVSFPNGQAYLAFSQNRVDAQLFAEYRLLDTVGLNASVRYDENFSERLRPRVAGAAVDDLDFSRWQAYIGLRWFM